MRAATDEDDSSSSSEVDEDAYSDDLEKDNKQQHDEKDSNERLQVATGKLKDESDPDKTSTTSIKEGWLWKKTSQGKIVDWLASKIFHSRGEQIGVLSDSCESENKAAVGPHHSRPRTWS